MTKVYTCDLSATTGASERDNVEDTRHETGIQDKNLYPRSIAPPPEQYRIFK
jgi:hypothetical protein